MIKIDLWEMIKNAFLVNWFFWLFLILLVVAILILASLARGKKPVGGYEYQPKNSVMTRSESEFFKQLFIAVEKQYHVFPQVHLDAILSYKIRGQSWFGAFRHINEKSVDFLICDLTNEKPLLAIELDDRSHEREDRKERDEEVERIFEKAGLPLLRFGDHNQISQKEIAQRISEILVNKVDTI